MGRENQMTEKVGGFINEFKQFAVKGNMVDMAVGIIIGGAFGKIISSLVNDIIMPPLGVILGGVDFTDLKIILKAASANTTAVTLNYGQFIQVFVNFVIVAFSIFLAVKTMNVLKKKEEEAPAIPPAPSNQEMLLTEIRDLLRNR
jgi:large conductance mechanosensitive channel